jgi:hypothetical protein
MKMSRARRAVYAGHSAFVRVFFFGRDGEAPVTLDVPDVKLAARVSPNAIRDCELARVPFWSDAMYVGRGERSLTFGPRAWRSVDAR